MENKFQNSFIPQKQGATIQQTNAQADGIFYISSIVIFILSFVALGAMFGWGWYVSETNSKLLVEIDERVKSVDSDAMDEYKALDDRIKVSQELLNNHVALSGFFEELEPMTVESVQFQTFNFEESEGESIVRMDGTADGFNAVALQSDQFKHSESLKDSRFFDLDLDDEGQVIFTAEAVLSNEAVLYPERFNELSSL